MPLCCHWVPTRVTITMLGDLCHPRAQWLPKAMCCSSHAAAPATYSCAKQAWERSHSPLPQRCPMQAATTTDLPALDDLKAEHEACLAAVEHIFKTANAGLEAGCVNTTFRCPITQEIFRDPVLAPSGTSFERSAIQLWLVVSNCVLQS